jgi:hypothetical protein
MTLFTHLPLPVLTILMFFVGMLFLYYTSKVAVYNRVGLSSFVLLAFSITIINILSLLDKLNYPYGAVFGVIILIFIIWVIVGVIVKSFLINNKFK